MNYLSDVDHVASSHSQSRQLRDAEPHSARVGVMATRLQVSGNQLPVHDDVHLLELALHCTAVPVLGHVQGNLMRPREPVLLPQHDLAQLRKVFRQGLRVVQYVPRVSVTELQELRESESLPRNAVQVMVT